MRSSIFLTCVGALTLAACSAEPAGETEAEPGEEEAGTEPQQLTPVDSEPVVEAPALAPISRVEIEAELEPGAGCSVEEDGKALLVAVDGDAIARPYGTLRHFTFEDEAEEGLDALWDGGTFTAGAISIAIEPEDGEGEQIEGVNVRSATITVSDENEDNDVEFEAAWECGA